MQNTQYMRSTRSLAFVTTKSRLRKQKIDFKNEDRYISFVKFSRDREESVIKVNGNASYILISWNK